MQSSKTVQSKTKNVKNKIQSHSKRLSAHIMKRIKAKYILPGQVKPFITITLFIKQENKINPFNKHHSAKKTDAIHRNIIEALAISRGNDILIWEKDEFDEPLNQL